jgi:hypothetical protein
MVTAVVVSACGHHRRGRRVLQVGLAAVLVLVAEDPVAHDSGWRDRAGCRRGLDGQVDLASADDVFGQHPVIKREGRRRAS